MKRYGRLLSAAILLLSGGRVLGNEEAFTEAFEEEEILIEGEVPGTVEPGVPGQAATISREELKASGARTLAEYLQRIPGLQVHRRGGILEGATLSIRGSSPEQVLVLVDGVAQNGLWGGAVNLNSLPLERIEKIEILRGGGSALHGEGALGGVIRLTTAKPEVWNPELSITGGAGAFQTFIAGVALSGGLDKEGALAGRLFGEGISTGGSYLYSSNQGDALRHNNRGLTGSLSGGLSWSPDDGTLRLEVSGETRGIKLGVPGLMEFLTPQAEQREFHWGGGLSLFIEGILPGRTEISLGGGRRVSAYENPQENFDESHDNLGGTLRISWKGSKAGREILLSGSAGAEGRGDRLESTGFTDSTGTALNGEARQFTGSLWGSLAVSAGFVTLSPALRFDHATQDYLGRDLLRRNALSWSLVLEAVWGRITAELSGQSSYHNPSFQDLFWPSGAFAAGNPDLLPEQGLGVDMGLTWDIRRGTLLGAAGFYQRVSHLIQWLPSAGGIWRPGNIGEVDIYGGEIFIKGLLPLGKDGGEGSSWFFEYQGGYDWLRCRDATEDSVNYGNQLAYRSEHSGSASFLFSAPGGSSLEITGTFQGTRYTNNANTKEFNPLLLVDASLRVFITPSWEISLSGRNLTNQSYIDRLGYPVPGIDWTIKGGFHY